MEDKRELCIMSLQLDISMRDYLKEKARRECTSTSYLIRKMILKDMREDMKDGE